MSKHTPGPWLLDGLKVRPAVWDGVVIAEVRSGLWEESEANARLIASAPMLLELLQDLADPESGCRLNEHALKNIRAALAKATGGAE